MRPHGSGEASHHEAPSATAPFAGFPSGFQIAMHALLYGIEAAAAALEAAELELEEAQTAVYGASQALQDATAEAGHSDNRHWTAAERRTYLQPYQTELADCQAWVVRATQARRNAKAHYDAELQKLARSQAAMQARANGR